MAKYKRYDSRNKKKNRNKMRSLDRDIHIRELEENDRNINLMKIIKEKYDEKELFS